MLASALASMLASALASALASTPASAPPELDPPELDPLELEPPSNTRSAPMNGDQQRPEPTSDLHTKPPEQSASAVHFLRQWLLTSFVSHAVPLGQSAVVLHASVQ